MKRFKYILTFPLLLTFLNLYAQEVNPLNTTSLEDYYCLQVETGRTLHYSYMVGVWSIQYKYVESTMGETFKHFKDCVKQYKCLGFRYGEESYIDKNGIERTSKQYTHTVETPNCDIIKISHDKIDRCEDLLKKVLLRRED